jgi:hypothetical protein
VNRSMIAAIVTSAALCLGLVSAQAGPCSLEIAQFEQAVRASAGNPNAGPYGRQTIGAQLGQQPTPASIRRAQRRAQAQFAATLVHAKRLDARGDDGCFQALRQARDMYNLR